MGSPGPLMSRALLVLSDVCGKRGRAETGWWVLESTSGRWAERPRGDGLGS
jgi:hypothetical protein